MPDQAAQLRKLVRVAARADPSLASGGPIVAVSGGRARWAATVACQLARELARLGKQVVLIDANVLRPGAATHFGLHSDADDNIDAILRGARPRVEVLVDVEQGLRLLPGVPPAKLPRPSTVKPVDHFRQRAVGA